MSWPLLTSGCIQQAKYAKRTVSPSSFFFHEIFTYFPLKIPTCQSGEQDYKTSRLTRNPVMASGRMATSNTGNTQALCLNQDCHA